MPRTETDAKLDDAGEIGGVVGEESSASYSDGAIVDDNSDNLISTIDDDGSDDFGGVDISSGGVDVEKGLETVTDKVTDETGTTDKVEDEVKADDDTVKVEEDIKIEKIPEQFDKHPAWHRLMDEIKDLRTQVTEKAATAKETETDSTIVDINTLTDEELAEWQTDDPKGYADNLLKLVTQKSRENFQAERQADDEKKKAAAEEERANKTYDTYAAENKATDDGTGFMQMWDSGKLSEFMKENPGHNAISAHMVLTEASKAQSEEERIKAGIAEGVAAEKKRLAAESKARQRTVGLNQGPAYTSKANDDDELKDTSKRGGKVAVMAERLKRMRQGA